MMPLLLRAASEAAMMSQRALPAAPPFCAARRDTRASFFFLWHCPTRPISAPVEAPAHDSRPVITVIGRKRHDATFDYEHSMSRAYSPQGSRRYCSISTGSLR